MRFENRDIRGTACQNVGCPLSECTQRQTRSSPHEASPCRESFEHAKVIGRRNTFIDGLFSIVFNRDRELADIAIRVAVYLVVNMATATFVMFWLFLAGLPRFMWSFGATWVRRPRRHARSPCSCGCM